VDVEVEKERKELKLQRNLPVPLTQSAAEPIKVCGVVVQIFVARKSIIYKTRTLPPPPPHSKKSPSCVRTNSKIDNQLFSQERNC
jgi:hypothetical protein